MFARQYRDGLDRDFVQDMLTVQSREEIPGFAAWWNPDPLQRAGQTPRLTADARNRFLADTQTPQFWLRSLKHVETALYKTNDQCLGRPPKTG